jgi:hypothetical protein
VGAVGDHTNMQRYSQAFNSWATITRSSIPTTNAASLDPNSSTACIFRDTVDNSSHYIGDTAYTVTNGGIYTGSVYAKKITKDWIYLEMVSGVAPKNCYFNLSSGRVGTTSNAICSMVSLENGWYRLSITITAVAVTGYMQIASASADGVLVYVGTPDNCFYIWGAQFELGSHATSYCPTTTGTCDRLTDSMTELPYRLNTGNLLTGTETWWTKFDQDVASAGAVALGTPAKTFTQAGDTKHIKDVDNRDYYSFDGTGDYLTIADSSFNPCQADPTLGFSVVSVIKPLELGGASFHFPIAKGANGAGNTGWYLYTNSNHLSFAYSENGTTEYINTKNSGLNVGKLSLVTVTWKKTGVDSHESNVYIDDLTVATKTTGAMDAIFPSATNFAIGARIDASAYPFLGSEHFLSYHDNTVLSATQHSDAYSRLFENGVMPTAIAASGVPATWVDISWDMVCPFSGSTNQGGDRTFFTVGGNFNTAGQYKNKLHLYVTAGKVTGDLFDAAGTVDGSAHRVQSTADAFDLSKKHSYRFYVNAADLGSTDFWVDGVNTAFSTRTNVVAGTTILTANAAVFRDGQVRYGQTYDGTTNSDCAISNLKIKYGV